MLMFHDISRGTKDNEKECTANAKVISKCAKKFGIGKGSFIGPGSEKKRSSKEENCPQGAWGHFADEMLLDFAESGHPIFRATIPLSRGSLKSKRHGELSIHFAAEYPTIETVFRKIIAVNQLSIFGAVAALCEEFQNHQDGSGEPEILMGQSIVLGEIKAEIPLQNENPLNHQILWQQYEERIESLSPESKVSKLCMGVRSWKHQWLLVCPVKLRKIVGVTSTSAKDLAKARMDERMGFESCSTTRRGSCSTTRRRSCSKRNSSKQPNQLQVQFVTDRSDLTTCKMEETRPVLRRSMEIQKKRRT